MSFRARVGLALAVAALLPLAALALVVRSRVTERLSSAYEQRVAALAAGIDEELARRDTAIASRLASVADAMRDDNRLRLAVAQRTGAERDYLLDYGERAMRLTGLSMFQVQDESGRVLTSGHFRNEYDRLEPELLRALSGVTGRLTLVRARAPDGPFFALVRTDSVQLGGHRLTLVGGEAIDERDLARMEGGGELHVALYTPQFALHVRLPETPGGAGNRARRGAASTSSSPGVMNSTDIAGDTTSNNAASTGTGPPGSGDAALVRRIALPYVRADTSAVTTPDSAFLVITQPRAAIAELRASIDRWFILVAASAAALALIVAAWFSARVSRPITTLAEKTSALDLDRLDVDFRSEREDEIGDLSRLLGAMTTRLRTSARRLREAERRAAVGELARQVNHDIKNGLVPIRNVMRHLGEVRASQPEELSRVLAEREGTVESSLAYLESLAQSYARLSPKGAVQPCDVGAVVLDVVQHARGAPEAVVIADVRPRLPAVMADPVALRRILENLVGNAVDSLEGSAGNVSVTAERVDGASRRDGAPANTVRLTVQDSGRGMTREELARAFDDFYTTKPGGTGLGLSVVRRLVMDLHGTMRVDTKPGEGTRFVIELPAGANAESGAPAVPPEHTGERDARGPAATPARRPR
ncbi:MAG TPA: HAMP domain-containing sensor histidine kinase [Gemmatimonadaceae bacterium]|nr:HAMP domain-containing sensor histidine kinase [Gemmatimonadaceae bacterium]